MPDPLSIATGVVSLLGATYTLAVELKKFRDGVLTVRSTVEALITDVDGLRLVLESMRDTFANITAEYGTGSVASHWRNVAQALADGMGILAQLQELVLEVNKTTKFLDGPRKQLRLNFATDQIASYRQHIQSFRDTLQLSMQTILLWNQVSYSKSTEQILPGLSDMHQDVRRIALEMNRRIETLQAMVATKNEEQQVVAMANLRNCVKSAATLVSSASTIVASEKAQPRPREVTMVVPASDFGDCFPVEDNIMLRRWMESRTVHEDDESEPEGGGRNELVIPPASVADIPVIGDSENGSDSEDDLESEMTSLLLRSGKDKLSQGDSTAAERLLRNCLSRLATTGGNKLRSQRADIESTPELEVMQLLYALYHQQRRWAEARSMWIKRMALKERLLGKNDPTLPAELLTLARLTQLDSSPLEAQLHARRALKAYRKAKDTTNVVLCLQLLIEVCEEREDEREAYATMLEGLLSKSDIDVQATVVTPNGGKDQTSSVLLEPMVDGTQAEDIPDAAVNESSERAVLSQVASSDSAGCEAEEIPEASQLEQLTLNEQAPPAQAETESTGEHLEATRSLLEDSMIRRSLSNTTLMGTVDISTGANTISPPTTAGTARTDTGSPLGKADRVPLASPLQGLEWDLAESANEYPHTTDDKVDVDPVVEVANREPSEPATAQIDENGIAIEPGITTTGWNNSESLNSNSGKVSSSSLSVPSLVSGPSTGTEESASTLQSPSFADMHFLDPRLIPSVHPLKQRMREREAEERLELQQQRNAAIRHTMQTPLSEIRQAAWSVASEAGTDADASTEHKTPRSAKRNAIHGSDDLPALSSSVADAVELPEIKRKFGFVGDGMVGKTHLLKRFVDGVCPEVLSNSPFDFLCAIVEVDGKSLQLLMADTPGQEDYDRTRPLYYPGTHVIFICFNIMYPDSLDNVEEKWLAEVRHFLPDIPLILVGCQKELRDDANAKANLAKSNQQPVPSVEAEEMCWKIGAAMYFECSAVTGEGVKELFEYAARISLIERPKKRKSRFSRLFGAR